MDKQLASGEVFIDEELTDWGQAAYMAGLSTDSDKIDEELRSAVVSQLNKIREGLNKQQEGIIMQRDALDKVTLYQYSFGTLNRSNCNTCTCTCGLFCG